MTAEQSEWIGRAQAGDQEAFAQLVAAYQKPVYNLCYRMLGNHRDAEDAAQETFLRAFKAIDRFDPQRKFITWLLSIASHHCIDQLRRRRLWMVSLEGSPHLHVKDPGLSPEQRVAQNQRNERVRALLDELSPTDRAAVVMHYWYDLSYAEIGEALSLTVSAVKSRLHRARRQMAQSWTIEGQTTLLEKRPQHDTSSL